MGVEESLVRYERGTFLIQHCRAVLNKAQEQIEAVSKMPEAAGVAKGAVTEEGGDDEAEDESAPVF